MNTITCPRCQCTGYKKAGLIKNNQRYQCKSCNYYYTVSKMGKQLDKLYVIRALQLYLCGMSLRKIGELLGVGYVTVHYWIKKYNPQLLQLKLKNIKEVASTTIDIPNRDEDQEISSFIIGKKHVVIESMPI